jgi:ubiquitin carboxyl-terminal hydrolase 5/13
MYICLLDIDAPISKGSGSESVDQSKVDMLISFGFQDDVARKALKASVIFSFNASPFLLSMSDLVAVHRPEMSLIILMEIIALQGGDIEKATDWIFSNPDASVSNMDATASSTTSGPNDADLPDGGGSELLSHLNCFCC